MNCLDLLSAFLSSCQIPETSYSSALSKLSNMGVSDNCVTDFITGRQTIIRILSDVYSLNAPKVKGIANIISKHYASIGRYEKSLIKHYLDYRDPSSFDALLVSLEEIGVTEEFLNLILESFCEDQSDIAVSSFIKNWDIAEENADEPKKYDYLQGIYTRLVALLNENVLSLHDIYDYNLRYIEKELNEYEQEQLAVFCASTKKIPAAKARTLFCEKYEALLSEDLRIASKNNVLEPIMNFSSAAGTPFAEYDAEHFKLILININQSLFDASGTEKAFWDKVLSILYYSYRILDNHRTLAINIDNIYAPDGRNLKWIVYSYIGIFGEHFIPTEESRRFYCPEELCFEKCAYCGIDLSEANKFIIKKYYSKKASKSDVAKSLNIPLCKVDDILLDFENIWYGYTFSDCLSVVSGIYPQHPELSFIKNQTQLVMIFNKYRHDDRKIPCPECAGLNISGNSFPEVGLRSWECKNSICPSRSKSNRGKRYSKKSNFMQRGFDTGNKHDLISRDLIKAWRRDISEVSSANEITDMIVRYFSFDTESVLLINYDVSDGKTVADCHRVPTVLNISDVSSTLPVNNIFSDYFETGNYIRRYLNQKNHPVSPRNTTLTQSITASECATLIHGDSREVLSQLSDGIITAAVTSPPYYNARLYSQWSNLYLYLSDMYEIIKETYRVMRPGGVYLYNIGDICGNENTVVRSNMGNKRILLGAYTIHLFLSAGFELLDNMLWDKGEPQSNRQKNDGKFTPFYQKPMNVYEHMFIFKKPGAPIIVNSQADSVIPEGWNTNIVPLTPVIKINSKGENTLGHTAPFPLDIPNFVAKVFTEGGSDIVLEPFAGSGTSLIASTLAGVKSLGIELCDEYADLIENLCSENGIPLNRIN